MDIIDAIEAKRNALKVQKQEGNNLKELAVEVFKTTAGKALLDRLNNTYITGVSCFAPSDANKTAYNLGRADLIKFFNECLL
jgi:hypothetical protein